MLVVFFLLAVNFGICDMEVLAVPSKFDLILKLSPCLWLSAYWAICSITFFFGSSRVLLSLLNCFIYSFFKFHSFLDVLDFFSIKVWES